MSPPAPPPPPGPIERMGWLVNVLRQGLGRHAGRSHPAVLVPALTLSLLWNRLNRLARRFGQLVEMIEAGHVPPARLPRPRPATPHPRQPPVDPATLTAGERMGRMLAAPARHLPRRHGWLLAMGKHHAGAASDQLRQMLADPKLVALLHADPRRLGRVLRPLCWALAVDPPAIIAGPPPRRSRPASPPARETAASAPAAAPAAPEPPAPPRRPRRHPPRLRPDPTACGPPPLPA